MRWTAPQSIGPKPQRHCLSHFFPQPLSPNLHAAESEPFLAQVLQRGAEMIDGVVDVLETNLTQIYHKWITSFLANTQSGSGGKAMKEFREKFFVRERQTSSGLGGEVGPTWRGSARFVGRADDVGLDSFALSYQEERAYKNHFLSETGPNRPVFLQYASYSSPMYANKTRKSSTQKTAQRDFPGRLCQIKHFFYFSSASACAFN